MINITTKTSDGTSFHNTSIKASKSQLIVALGEPDYLSDCSDKVTTQWIREIDDNVFTIYDWKYYRDIENDELIEWNIGGKSASITETAKLKILNKLK
jgi:hypothetical protein